MVPTLFCRLLFHAVPTHHELEQITVALHAALYCYLCYRLDSATAKVHALRNARINWAKKNGRVVTEPPRACGAGNPETGAGVATTQAVRRDQGGFESGLQVGLAMKPRH